MNLSRMIIEANKTKASQAYERNTLNLRWKVYSDESEEDKIVTIATMNFNWNKKKCLKNAEIALTHHDELKSLIMIIEKLISRCEKSIDARNKIYKIYFDSQTSLKTIYIMSSIFDQKRLQKLQITTNRIRSCNAHLKLHWIFDHANIESNEMINKVTEKAHDFALISSTHIHHEVTTRMSFIRAIPRKIWDKKWKKEIKKAQYRNLISKVNHRHLNVHAERSKTHSALIIQLKTNKIEFNKFLHERRVLDVLTAHCSCDEEHMTIKHVLLFCSNWREKRREMLQRAKITNIRRLLSERKATTIVERMILTIDLLNQFQTTKLSKKKKTSRS